MVWWLILYYPILLGLTAVLDPVEKRYGKKVATYVFGIVWTSVYLFPLVYGLIWLILLNTGLARW
jgi:hypothetical protein